MKQIKVESDYEGSRLDRFLRKYNPDFRQGDIEIGLRKRLIRVNNKKVKSNYRLEPGDVVQIQEWFKVEENRPKPEMVFKPELIRQINESIIYRDKDILVMNKFHGLPVQAGSKVMHSLDRYLQHMIKDGEPKLVHRLDKDTTGVMIIALNNKSAIELARLFKEKKIEKKYWCITVGEFAGKREGTININLSQDFKVESGEEGKEAITKYRLIQRNQYASFFEMMPVTGRKHQIRATCVELGHPILGDGKYGGRNAFIKSLPNIIHLHAKAIEINDFFGKKLKFEAPLPRHMQISLEQLKFY